MNRNLVIATLAQVERDIREGELHLSVKLKGQLRGRHRRRG